MSTTSHSLRDRRRVAAKRAIQVVALDLFEASGFSTVTMEQIAVAAEVGVATVYRYFGTKERVVLWDEYDPLLFAGISGHLGSSGPFAAAQAAIRDSLDAFYVSDSRRLLRRARLVANAPALQVAVLEDLAKFRAGIVTVLTEHDSAMPRLEAEVAAGAIVGCLQAAIDTWVRAKGHPRLGRTIDEAFRMLRSLSRSRLPSKK